MDKWNEAPQAALLGFWDSLLDLKPGNVTKTVRGGIRLPNGKIPEPVEAVYLNSVEHLTTYGSCPFPSSEVFTMKPVWRTNV
jgi:hypothetical protein